MRSALSLLFLVALLPLNACSSGRGENGPAPPTPARTTVRIENQSFLDVTVYVLRSSQRIRLGSVPSVSTRVFTIPQNLVFGASRLRFLADPVGSSRTPVSQEITVQSGDEITLTIPNF